MRYGFGLPPYEEIRRKRARPSEIIENPETLGEHLKRARQLKRIRQKDAAIELGVGHFTYMTWEKNQKVPFPRYYPAIIKFVGYNPLPEGKTIGEQRKRERLTLGFTTDQMAVRLGCDPSTVERREKG